MLRVLTVDDSSTIRSIITKQLTEMGYEVDAAEDGAQGLAKLEEISYDLIVLDVTMPVMDGPTMLAKLREAGNETPVIMLTSESKRSIVAGAVKAGISGYILKPFKPEELRGKVQKALGNGRCAGAPQTGLSNANAGSQNSVVTGGSGGAVIGHSQFVDVLLVDDMENVHKKLRSLLPEQISMNACASAREALAWAKERVYRIVVIDTVIPDVDSVALMNQLRALQPQAAMVALALRSANDLVAEARAQGFADAIQKPFDSAAIDDFIGRQFDAKEVLMLDGNLITACKVNGKDDKVDRYFSRALSTAREFLEKLASGCYEEAIVDITEVPMKWNSVVRMLVEVNKQAKELGIEVRLVGTPQLKQVLGAVVETTAIPFFSTVGEARSAGA